jgi:hypothetical protein
LREFLGERVVGGVAQHVDEWDQPQVTGQRTAPSVGRTPTARAGAVREG